MKVVMGRGGHRLEKRGRFLDSILNVESEGESRTGWGRKFHSRDAVLEKALSLKVLSLDDGTVRVRVEAIRKAWGGRWGIRRSDR